MADILISNLPLYTGDTTGSYLVMNDSGETTTYKVTKETFIDTAVACYSWTTNYFNLSNGVENYPRWDTQVFNSNSNIFELVNSGIAGDTGARIYLLLFRSSNISILLTIPSLDQIIFPLS